MNKLVSRLFRDPSDAGQAVHHLIASGYKLAQIGILASSENAAKSVLGGHQASFHQVDGLSAAGCLIPALTKNDQQGDLKTRLKEALGVSPETAEYFSFGLGASGVLVVVETDEAKAGEAKALLGHRAPERKPVGAASPGFDKASRMSSTNPVDATMTGDFRKY